MKSCSCIKGSTPTEAIYTCESLCSSRKLWRHSRSTSGLVGEQTVDLRRFGDVLSLAKLRFLVGVEAWCGAAHLPTFMEVGAERGGGELGVTPIVPILG